MDWYTLGMRWIYIIALNILLLQPAVFAGEITLIIEGQHIRATLSSTPQSRQKGLMNQKRLCKNCGVLFVFPKTGKYKFWMKDTPLPLSIAFIAADGTILELEEMQANTSTIHSAHENILYALEMHKGWFAEHSVKINEIVQGLQNAPLGE